MFVAVALVSSAAVAQSKVAIGIKAGPSFANFSCECEGTLQGRKGFHVGAFTLIRADRFGFQPEILFSQQGSIIRYGNLYTLSANYNYINMPLMLKIYPIAGVNIQAGPQVGFLASAESEDQWGQMVDIKDQLNKADLALAVGIGWDIPFGLSIDGRYNLGISDVNGGPPAGKLKNRVWQFSVGYKVFKIGSVK